MDKELKKILDYMLAVEDQWKAKVKDHVVMAAEWKRATRCNRNLRLVEAGGFRAKVS